MNEHNRANDNTNKDQKRDHEELAWDWIYYPFYMRTLKDSYGRNWVLKKKKKKKQLLRLKPEPKPNKPRPNCIFMWAETCWLILARSNFTFTLAETSRGNSWPNCQQNANQPSNSGFGWPNFIFRLVPNLTFFFTWLMSELGASEKPFLLFDQSTQPNHLHYDPSTQPNLHVDLYNSTHQPDPDWHHPTHCHPSRRPHFCEIPSLVFSIFWKEKK